MNGRRRTLAAVMSAMVSVPLAAVTTPAAATPGSSRFASTDLSDDIAAYLHTRHGSVSVAIYDRTAKTWTLVHPRDRMHTASIVKVDILETLLHRSHGELSSSQRSLAHRMIEDSDNDAATQLWDEDDGHVGIAKYDRALGLTQVDPNAAGAWGLTTTSAHDQVQLVRALLAPSKLLTDGARRYQRSLMRHVTPSQRWGVSAGPGAGVDVGLKNGWLPVASDHDRWAVNSIGWVHGDGRNYVIAVLTAHESSMGYGITTIEHISRLAWSHVEHG